MKPELYGVDRYRKDLAQTLTNLRNGKSHGEAREHLSHERQGVGHILARSLKRKSDELKKPLQEEKPMRVVNGATKEHKVFGYYHSNEYYAGLARTLSGMGGVGLAVGSDQGMDFFIMANLDEVYVVDVDAFTHIRTRSYLETGTRFHKLHNRYPTVNEFIEMFRPKYWDVTVNMLELPSTLYNFTRQEILWLWDHGNDRATETYLTKKHDHYNGASWISTNDTLKQTIAAYEKGKIHVSTGDIRGKVIPKIAKEIAQKKQTVSLIYTSNAPIRQDATLDVFAKLPVTKKTQVVFSTCVTSAGFEYSRPPQGYSSALFWTYVVFPLAGSEHWPDLDKDGRWDYQQVASGCYRLKNPKK